MKKVSVDKVKRTKAFNARFNKFLESLGKYTWEFHRIYPDSEDMIRSWYREGRTACPLTRAAERYSWLFSECGKRDFGFTHQECQAIANASDGINEYEPWMRKKILKATGLA